MLQEYKKIRDGVESTFSKVWRLLSTKEKLDCWKKEIFHMKSRTWWNNRQGCSEGTSSVAFEISVKYKFIQLQLFDVKFLFSEEHIFHKQKRTDVYGRASLIAGFNSTRKMMACYLRDRNKIFRYRTLCRNILKCKFPTKGIELTRLEFFEGPLVPQLWSSWFRPFR